MSQPLTNTDNMQFDDEDPDYLARGVIYKPCLFCGSLEYDLAEGEVDVHDVYEPKTCDQCGFGMELPHKLKIH